MSTLLETCVATHGAEFSINLLGCINDGTEAARADLISGVDTFYLLIAGALVYFMQIGFAMLCAGSIREKNVKNILLWCLLDSSGGAFGFWSIGYALAYGGDDNTSNKTFVGNSGFFLATSDIDLAFWFFQYTFATAVSSIVAGAIAERTKMEAYLTYSIFLCGFVYPVCAHAFWSQNGFLSAFAKDPLWGTGAIDLAGSGPVHLCGGAAALVMAIILGPRKGRFYDEHGRPLEEPKAMGPHSVLLQFLGTFFLWFGWYGFNPGSTLMISSGQLGSVASLAAVNTTLGAAAGALSGMFTKTIIDERQTWIFQWDTTAAMNGALTGLVAITAGCATVEPWAGFVIGVLAGWIYLGASALILKLKIDDAVDAIPVHLFGGAWGVIATGLFSNAARMEAAAYSTENLGWFYEWGRGSGNFTLMGIQLISVLFVFGWTTAVFIPFCLVLKFFGHLRIDALEEEVGMDISRHKGPAYKNDGFANSEAVIELAASRRNLMDTSLGHSSTSRSFSRRKPLPSFLGKTVETSETASVRDTIETSETAAVRDTVETRALNGGGNNLNES